jgi:hypothetical protein
LKGDRQLDVSLGGLAVLEGVIYRWMSVCGHDGPSAKMTVDGQLVAAIENHIGRRVSHRHGKTRRAPGITAELPTGVSKYRQPTPTAKLITRPMPDFSHILLTPDIVKLEPQRQCPGNLQLHQPALLLFTLLDDKHYSPGRGMTNMSFR